MGAGGAPLKSMTYSSTKLLLHSGQRVRSSSHLISGATLSQEGVGVFVFYSLFLRQGRPMVLLPDDQAGRIRAMLRTSRDPQLAEWTARLLEDRAERSALLQELARQLHHLRQRVSQASRYIDGLIVATHEMTRRPWPQKLPCPVCGAPVDQVVADWRPDEERHHVLVHIHVDGRRCEPQASTTPAADPKGGRPTIAAPEITTPNAGSTKRATRSRP